MKNMQFKKKPRNFGNEIFLYLHIPLTKQEFYLF